MTREEEDAYFLSMTKEEKEAWDKKCVERARHYDRLDFDYRTPEDIDDDELWEKAKKLPIDTSNRADRFKRAFRMDRVSWVIRDREELAKEMMEEIAEAQSRKLISKEELLERIRQHEEGR